MAENYVLDGTPVQVMELVERKALSLPWLPLGNPPAGPLLCILKQV